MQKIVPFLWFDDKAEEAANFYVSIFKNSKITGLTRYGEGAAGPKGSVMSVTFELDGRQYYALNGGPVFKFTEAFSLFVNCEDQKEVDDLWEKLSAGGAKSRCGWLKDKYGLSWQIVPTVMEEMIKDKDEKKLARVTEAFLKMKKFDIAALKRAYKGV